MKPLVLCILDGCGIRKSKDGNAFKNANKPFFNMLWKKYPHSLLKASGTDVGLPKGQMGTSEVGHMNIGSGRLTYQPLEFINRAIKDKSFYKNEELLKVMNHVKENNSNLHIMGLISNGGVHSDINHLFAIIDMCKMNNVKNVYFDLFTDGRDVYEKSALSFIEKLEEKIKKTGIGKIATISGRYYGMDRDNNFDRLKKSYDAIIYGDAKECSDAKELINENYNNNITDEFIVPGIINKKPLNDNDGLIVFNFRKDRLREILTCITNINEYNDLALEKDLKLKEFNNLKVVTMMPVVETVKAPYAFDDIDMKNILVDYLHKKNISQLRIAETEKFAHVTFFFDGGKEVEYDNLKKILVPSPKVATYDLKPEMSVYEVTEEFLKNVDKYDVTVMNLANGDMVGHTGNYEAAKDAVEHMDKCLEKIYNKVKELDGTLMIIADHGNCDIMWDKNKLPVTSHTTSLVPCIVTNKKIKLNNGRLCDIAPTMLELMNIEKPKEMTGKSLIGHNLFKNIFMILSIIAMLTCVIIYSTRLVHYYKIEHPKVVGGVSVDNSLVNKILDDNEIATKGSGLYVDDYEYVFKGNSENNYVYYSGMLFRIVRINANRTIKLVTDDITTSLVWGYETDYENSYVKKYLEDEFYNRLNNPDDFIAQTYWCVDNITKKTDLCEETVFSKVGLLTYNDYVEADSNNSYLNINKYWWLINTYRENKIWYVFDQGGVNNNSNSGSNYYNYGVRPVINLKSGVNYISGDGTKENPYIIEEEKEIKLGSFINYSNNIWQVINIDENSIKLVMNDCLKENDVCIERSMNTVKFNKNYGLGYYLNSTFYNSLDKTHIVDGTWYNGNYGDETNYDYKNIYTSELKAKVGLLNIAENNKTNSYTINSVNDELINSSTKNGTLYYSDGRNKLHIYPSIYIDRNIKILEGLGTIDSPFIIE